MCVGCLAASAGLARGLHISRLSEATPRDEQDQWQFVFCRRPWLDWCGCLTARPRVGRDDSFALNKNWVPLSFVFLFCGLTRVRLSARATCNKTIDHDSCVSLTLTPGSSKRSAWIHTSQLTSSCWCAHSSSRSSRCTALILQSKAGLRGQWIGCLGGNDLPKAESWKAERHSGDVSLRTAGPTLSPARS